VYIHTYSYKIEKLVGQKKQKKIGTAVNAACRMFVSPAFSFALNSSAVYPV